eukprot:COSAG02_NODE_2610_length_8431_cov_94.540206_7_plen_255_part_00
MSVILHDVASFSLNPHTNVLTVQWTQTVSAELAIARQLSVASLVARPDLSKWNRRESRKVVKELRIRLERKVSPRHVNKARVGCVKLLWTHLLKTGSNRPATDRGVKRVTIGAPPSKRNILPSAVLRVIVRALDMLPACIPRCVDHDRVIRLRAGGKHAAIGELALLVAAHRRAASSARSSIPSRLFPPGLDRREIFHPYIRLKEGTYPLCLIECVVIIVVLPEVWSTSMPDEFRQIMRTAAIVLLRVVTIPKV